MGNWGVGLYDSDAALDNLGRLVLGGDLRRDEAHLSVGMCLIAWLLPADLAAYPDKYRALLRKSKGLVAKLPSGAKKTLQRLEHDPEAFAAEKVNLRPDHLVELLGNYSNGPRHDALLRVPAAEEVLSDFADRCMAHLEGGLESEDQEEPEGPLAALGVLLHLHDANLWSPPPARVRSWKRSFRALDKLIEDDRDVWDDYAACVSKAFSLLTKSR